MGTDVQGPMGMEAHMTRAIGVGRSGMEAGQGGPFGAVVAGPGGDDHRRGLQPGDLVQ